LGLILAKTKRTSRFTEAFGGGEQGLLGQKRWTVFNGLMWALNGWGKKRDPNSKKQKR